jgi:hypothetical protein
VRTIIYPLDPIRIVYPLDPTVYDHRNLTQRHS